MAADIDGLVQEIGTPLITNWSYVFLALTCRYVDSLYNQQFSSHGIDCAV